MSNNTNNISSRNGNSNSKPKPRAKPKVNPQKFLDSVELLSVVQQVEFAVSGQKLFQRFQVLRFWGLSGYEVWVVGQSTGLVLFAAIYQNPTCRPSSCEF